MLEAAQRKQMGILALKSMARRPWPEGAAKTHPKCWYEPLATETAAREGLRFTLSHPVTAAIPPGDENLFRMALDLAASLRAAQRGRGGGDQAQGARDNPALQSLVVWRASCRVADADRRDGPRAGRALGGRARHRGAPRQHRVDRDARPDGRAGDALPRDRIASRTAPRCWRASSSSPSSARCTTPSR